MSTQKQRIKSMGTIKHDLIKQDGLYEVGRGFSYFTLCLTIKYTQ
jgi:hypothetical protein